MRAASFLVASLMVGLNSWCSHAAPRKDPGLMRISRQELRQLIQRTPVESPEHSKLISRAAASHLYQAAYEEYTLLWQRHRNNAYANLFRGVAAQIHWEEAEREVEKKVPYRRPPELDKLRQIAGSSLARAAVLERNARTLTAYGFWLWRWGQNLKRGMALMQEAVSLAPKYPGIRIKLGEAYSNPSPGVYNPKRAEEELRIALELAPSAAAPHFLLMRVYEQEKRYKEARRELQAYLALAPPQTAQESWVKDYQARIARGLGR